MTEEAAMRGAESQVRGYEVLKKRRGEKVKKWSVG
jgi:hypothetical protein